MMAKLERSTQPARMEAVSRDALVQAALQEITQNYREASLSNVARATRTPATSTACSTSATA